MSEDLLNTIEEYEKEIERLKTELQDTKEHLGEFLHEQEEENKRLNNIIYTTLEYVDREEINSTGKPYIYTERGKHIKELLEGERTFNSLWQENNRLNNIIEKVRECVKHKIVECYDEGSTIGEFYKICDIDSKIEELLHKGSDKE